MKYYIETVFEFIGFTLLLVIFTALAIILVAGPCILTMWVYKTLFGG